VLEKERFIISCRKSFAKTHGISEWEAAKLFWKYDTRGFINEYYPIMGHYSGSAIKAIRGDMLRQGGVLPDMIL